MMILIDALYINNSGGKVLLDYLIETLEETTLEVFYLLDSRIKDNVPYIKKSNHILFLDASLFNRYKFYNKNKKNFSKVLCFGNLPPNIKINARVYTYFHQLLYIKLTDRMSIKDKLFFFIKTSILRCIKKNTDYWIVQSDQVKNGLEAKFNIEREKILVLPFYKKSPRLIVDKEPYSYLYVSNVSAHKNHIRLIEAFSEFYLESKKGKLILTIPNNQESILNLIEEKIKLGINIKNIGFIRKLDLIEIYAKSEFFIFPSLSESLGLGLVEAIEQDCKILGADLPYMHAVCKPSIIFDPLDTKSIKDALKLSLNSEVQNSQSLINNEIVQIINLLAESNNNVN